MPLLRVGISVSELPNVLQLGDRRRTGTDGGSVTERRRGKRPVALKWKRREAWILILRSRTISWPRRTSRNQPNECRHDERRGQPDCERLHTPRAAT